MAYATQTRGFRIITVAGVTCRWRLSMHEHGSTITIQSARTKGGQQVLATLPGYPDPWIHFPVVPFRSVTPSLVRRVVERALALGWRPELRAGPLRFGFHPEANHAG